jgi:hypothetical protein
MPQSIRAAMRLDRLPVRCTEFAALEVDVSVIEPVHEQRLLTFWQEDFHEPTFASSQGGVETTRHAGPSANRDQMSLPEQPAELADCSQQLRPSLFHRTTLRTGKRSFGRPNKRCNTDILSE